jgi:hypothetical protein
MCFALIGSNEKCEEHIVLPSATPVLGNILATRSIRVVVQVVFAGGQMANPFGLGCPKRSRGRAPVGLCTRGTVGCGLGLALGFYSHGSFGVLFLGGAGAHRAHSYMLEGRLGLTALPRKLSNG